MSPLPREAVEIGVPLAAFLYGAVVGSFLNVVIYRLPRAQEGLTVAKPSRSLCPGCGAQISWYDNVPIVSYFALAGRCRACRCRIPFRYFGVELLTGFLFAYVAFCQVVEPMSAGADARWGVLLVHVGLLASMVAVTFIDIDHQIIPDRIDKPGIVLAFLVAPIVPELHVAHGDLGTLSTALGRLGVEVAPAFSVSTPWVTALLSCALGAGIGAGVVYVIGVCGKAVFRKEAMGFGDVKYMAMLGGYLGWKGVFLTLLVASLVGAVVGCLIRVFARTSYVPFGPFLSLGALVVLFWRRELSWLLFEWYPRWLQAQSLVA
ncbi:prepilin peptidase [Planctomycetota bacterium]